ncbi:copper chaperone PCu(A)C [Novosphingobium sp. Chol11]|uniref:copper chaperone PCu(A)C n=1 Tax=Novosphingobium sp. Chol11 TaxID=1385763 RepID=UPI0025FD5BE8|nr:copper chaperone PCu(A)C [Novosphingobium sp. Chol11]
MRLLLAAALAVLPLALAACQPSAPEPASSTAAPDAAPGIALKDAVIQLPAVAGRPGAAYFTVSQSGGAARKLVAVYVDGAKRSEMHESGMKDGMMTMAEVKEVALGDGKTVIFKPGGYHAMLFEVVPSLRAGESAEITITLDNGDKVSAPAKIKAVGSDAGHMGHR